MTIHTHTDRGDTRERSVPCGVCARSTFNVCALCDRHHHGCPTLRTYPPTTVMRTQPDAPTATLPVIPDTQRIDMAALIAAQNRHPSRSLSMTQLAEQVAAAAPTAAQLHDLAETVAALHDLINDAYTAQAEHAAITQQSTRAMAAIVATLDALAADVIQLKADAVTWDQR